MPRGFPNTVAVGQDKGLRPGSPAYQEELEKLLSGRITYEAFMRTIEGRPPVETADAEKHARA